MSILAGLFALLVIVAMLRWLWGIRYLLAAIAAVIVLAAVLPGACYPDQPTTGNPAGVHTNPTPTTEVTP